MSRVLAPDGDGRPRDVTCLGDGPPSHADGSIAHPLRQQGSTAPPNVAKAQASSVIRFEEVMRPAVALSSVILILAACNHAVPRPAPAPSQVVPVGIPLKPVSAFHVSVRHDCDRSCIEVPALPLGIVRALVRWNDDVWAVGSSGRVARHRADGWEVWDAVGGYEHEDWKTKVSVDMDESGAVTNLYVTHENETFRWLQNAWVKGSPGGISADAVYSKGASAKCEREFVAHSYPYFMDDAAIYTRECSKYIDLPKRRIGSERWRFIVARGPAEIYIAAPDALAHWDGKAWTTEHIPRSGYQKEQTYAEIVPDGDRMLATIVEPDDHPLYEIASGHHAHRVMSEAFSLTTIEGAPWVGSFAFPGRLAPRAFRYAKYDHGMFSTIGPQALTAPPDSFYWHVFATPAKDRFLAASNRAGFTKVGYYNGEKWLTLGIPESERLFAAIGPPEDLWAAGSVTIHGDITRGTMTSPLPPERETGFQIRSIARTGTSVYLLAEGMTEKTTGTGRLTVVRGNDIKHVPITDLPQPKCVVVASDDEIYAGNQWGEVAHFDGKIWRRLPVRAPGSLFAGMIVGDDVWLTGARGVLRVRREPRR